MVPAKIGNRFAIVRRTITIGAVGAIVASTLSTLVLPASTTAQATGTNGSSQWITAVSGTEGSTGVATFGSTGVTATLTGGVANECGNNTAYQVTNAQLMSRNANAFFTPPAPSDAVGVAQCLLTGATATRTVTFNKPVIDPVFSLNDLDGSNITFSAAPGGGAIQLTTLSKNTPLNLTGGTTLSNTFITGTDPCENTPQDPGNDPGCGSFQITEAGGPVTSFTMTNTTHPSGGADGWLWSIAFPTAQLTKAFSPSTIPAGAASHLTFTVANPALAGAAALSPLDFTDALPAGLTLADATESDNGSCGTPTVTNASSGALAAGGTSVKATNVNSAVGSTCSITVDVTSSTPGGYTDNTSNLSTNLANLVPNTSTTLTVTSASTACTVSTAYLNNGAQLESAVMGGPGALTFSAVGAPAANNYNALAYDPTNALLYAVGGPSDTHLMVINPTTGAVTDAGVTVPPLAANADWGTFDAAGDYLEGVSTSATLNVINVSTLAVATTTLIAAPGSSDLTFGPGGFLWGMKSGANTVVRVNPTTGVVSTFAGPVGLPAGTYGADFTYGNGNIGVENNAGGLYQLAIANPAATPSFTVLAHQTSPASSNNDGASCISAQPVDLAITKNGPSTFTSGAPISYTINVTNNGPGVSSGYVVNDALPPSLVSPTTTTPGCTIATGALTCTQGQLAVGSSVSVTVNATAPSGVLPAGITNSAIVTGNESDPVSANNADSTTATVGGPAFTCNPLAYLFQASGGVESWYTVDLATGKPTPLGNLPVGINGVGYNTKDNFFYGWGGGQLLRVNPDGSVVALGIPAGLVTTNAYDAGDFDTAGHLWLNWSGTPLSHWAEIDLAPGSPTYGQVLAHGDTAVPNNLTGGGDWSWINGKLYYVGSQIMGAGQGDYLVQFDPTTGHEANLGILGFTDSIIGATYTDANGNLYASDNTTGNIYRINVTTVTSTFIAKGPAASGNDGARCAVATVPTITITKAVAGRVKPTDQFTVNLKNSSGTTLTSKSTAGPDTTDSTSNWPVTEGSTYTFGETMVAGSPDPLTAYSATPTCTDTTTNTPINPGGTPQAWTLPVSTGDAYNCTITNTPAPGTFTVSKVASAASIQMGQSVTYTVTVKNTGAIAFTAGSPAKFTDDLSGVLDDATYNNDASVGATITGTTLSWSGALAVGATTTITYSVQVNDPDAGDKSLVNGVAPGPGGSCATSNSCSTTIPVLIPTPFTCQAQGLLYQTNGSSHTVTGIDLATGSPTVLPPTTDNVNALGYNVLDNNVYGWDETNNELARINADGSVADLGVPAGLVTTNEYQGGDFDTAGHLWIAFMGNPTHWAEIDLAPGSPTYEHVLGQGNVTAPANLDYSGADWSWVNGALYLVDEQTSGTTHPDWLVKFDPTTHTETTVGQTSFSAAVVGATYADAAGNLYASDNGTGNIYRIDVTSGTSTFIAKGPAATQNDGAMCAKATIPTITITKKINGARVQPTDQFTVSLKNSGGTTLTSKMTAGSDPSDSTTNWPVTQGNTYTFGEVMAAGSPDPLTAYSAVPTCTDTTTNTPIIPGGTSQAWTLPVTSGDNYNCTITNTPQPASFTVSKVASAPSIQMGQNLTYTVTVKNTGPIAFTAATPATFTDDLSGVLDDATYNNDATGGATITGTTLSWTGALAVGASTTITYSVQVNDPDTGDQTLVNGVTPGTSGTCATATSCQTTVPLVTPAAFGCTSPGYLFQNPNGISAPHTVTGIDLASGTPTPLGNVADDLNAVGYNTLDGSFYGWDATTQDVVRINADYSLTHVATGTGTPSTASIMGDFDNAGHLWIGNAAGATHQWAELDYAPGSPTYGQVLASGVYTNPPTLGGNADWSWLGGALYTVETVSANPAGPAHLVKFNPTTHVMTDLGALGINSTAGFGATYTDGTYMYAEDNGTGEIYRIDVAGVTSLAVAKGPASTGNDGARCPSAPIPTLIITKAIDARVQAGDQFTVNLKNSGGTTLTSKTTVGAHPSDSTTNFPVTQGSTYTFGETMAAGSLETLAAYNATPTCEDTTTSTPIAPGGTAQAWTLAVTSGDAYNCTITNTPAAGAFTVSKVASAPSIQMGQNLKYTVTVKNTGAVPFTGASPAKFTDDLSGVLDDATYNGDATGGATITGTTLTWTGPLAVGATTTITYSVQVNDPDAGDMSLVNGVVPGTDGACATSTSCQTIVPVVTPAPFTCNALGLLFQTNGSSHIITAVNLATGKTSSAGTTTDAVNAVGFNTLDDDIYGWDITTNQLVRVNGNGSLTTLPMPAGINSPSGYNMGDFDLSGHLWMSESASPGAGAPWVEIDLAPGSATYGRLIASGTTTIPNIANLANQGADWSWINGSLYSVGISTVDDARLFKFDPTTHTTVNLGQLAAIPFNAAITGFGGTYTDPAGDLFAQDNGTGNIYRINVTSHTATFIVKGAPSAQNDGARCALANIPTITVAKTVGGRVRAADQFTVGLDDSTGKVLTSINTSGSGGGPFPATAWPVTQGDTFTITDKMLTGSPDPLSDYTATISCTDTTTGTTAALGGITAAWTLTVTSPDAYLCTVDNSMQTVNLSVDKQSTPDPYTAGQALNYTVTVANAGPGPVNGATVTDPLPPALVGHGFTWTCVSTPGSTCSASGSGNISDTVNVAVGGTLTYTVTGTVPLGTTGTLTNTATVTPPIGVIDTNCTPSCSSVNNNPTPVVNTTKSLFTVNGVAANAATPVSAGDVLVYHIVSTNTGGALGSAALSDPVPANTTYTGTGEGWTSCPTGSVAGTACTQSVPVGAGASVTTNYTVTVVNPLPKGVTSIFNQVSSPSGCNSCTTTNPTAADLDTVKTLLTDNGTAATSTTMVNPGDVLVYQIVTTNSGGTAGTTTLKDPVPTNMAYTGSGEGWSCPTGSVVGTACNQTISVASLGSVTNRYTTTVVNPLPAGTTSVLNQVTSTGGSCSSCSPANPTGSLFSTSKSLISDNGKPADSSTKVAAGDVLVYQISVTNSGGSAGSQILHDPVPANTTYTGSVEGWTCPTGSVAGTACDQTALVGAGAVASVHYTITVVTPLPVNTTSIFNTVTAPGSVCDPTCSPTNPTAAVLTTGKALISDDGKPANSSTSVAAGDVLVYQITVTNTGGSSGNEGLSDPVPTNTTYTGAVGEGWSCPSGSVAGTACTQTVPVAGGAITNVTYTVTVVNPLPVGTTSISNSVTPGTGVCDPTCSPTNPTGAVLTTSKALLFDNGAAAGPTTQVAAGDVLVYGITVTNSGGSTGSQGLSDPVPTNAIYGGTGEGWSCGTGSVAGTACNQTISVAAGGTDQVDYTVTVVTPLPVNTTSISNTVTPTVGICDPALTCNPTNPTAAVMTTNKAIISDNGKPATSSTAVNPGDVLVYQITVINTGGSPGSQGLHDPVPANTTYTGTGEGWSCATGSPAATPCDQTVLVGAGGTLNTSYTVTVATPLPANTKTIANTVTPTIGICDPTCSPVNPTGGVFSISKALVSDNGKPATAATQVAAGDVLSYQITVVNSGGGPGTEGLSDPVPANTIYTGTGEGWSCASGSVAGTSCNQTVPVAAGATRHVAYTVTVVNPLPTGTSSVSNSVTPTVGICDPASTCSPTNPTAAVLSTSKALTSDNGTPADSSTVVAAGDVLVYRIVVTNTGGSAGVQGLSDPVPANTTYTGTGEGWSCPTGSLAGAACNQSVPVAGGAVASVNYTLKVVNPLPTNTTSISNTVTPTGGICDPTCSPTNPTAAVLSTSKVLLNDNGKPATPATQVAAGDVLVYQITVTNTGGAPDTQTLKDPVPANTTYTGTGEGWSCANGSSAGTPCNQAVPVGAGGTVNVSYTLTVVNPLPVGTASIFNSVTPTVGICDPTCSPTNPTAPVLSTAKVLFSDNGKPATASTQVAAGDALVYRITVTNSGGSAGTQGLSDPVPANTTYTGTGEGWTCPSGSAAGTACTQSLPVAAGGTATVTYTVTLVNPLPLSTQTITNTVTPTIGICDPSCSATNPTAAVLTTSKSLATDNGKPATASTQVAAGDVLVYQIVVTNTGGSPGSQSLSDPVPANTTYSGPVAEGWTCLSGSVAGTSCTQSLPVGANAFASANYSVTVVNPLSAGTTSIFNNVTPGTGICDPTCSPTNPTAPVLSTSKILLTDNGKPATSTTEVAAGDVLVYQITVTNSGGSAGTQGLSDPVPANTTYTGTGEGWTCPSGSAAGTACAQSLPVAAGGTTLVKYTVTVANPLPAGTASIFNTVTPTVGICDPTCSPTNPTSAVLATSKTLLTDNAIPATSSTAVSAGDVLVYQITVTNTGGSAGTQTLKDPVPANTIYAGPVAEGWTCPSGSMAGTACDQTVPVPAGGTTSATYTVTVVNPLPVGTTSIFNNVTPGTGVCDPTCSPTNPTAAVLSTSKMLLTDNGKPATPTTQVAAGDVLVYQITVTNTGGSPDSQTLKDPVPANTAYTGTGEGWTCPTGSAAGTACDQTVPVGAGGTVNTSYTVTVVNPLPVGTTSIFNNVTPGTGVCDPTCSPTNPTAAVLSTSKVLLTDNGKPATSATQVAAGDVLVYQITVTNSGGSAGTQTLKDPVPANTTYTGPVAEGWTCASGAVAGTACDQTVPVAAGGTAQVTYTVTVANPLPAGTASIFNNVTPTVGVCNPTCSPSNPTAAVLSTRKLLISDNGMPANSSTQVAAGDVLVYQITMTNTGGSAGSQGLQDPVPPNTTYTGTGEGWSCTSGAVAGTACNQTVPVPASATAQVKYTVTVANPLPVGTASIFNNVTPTIGVCDPTCSPTNLTAPVLSTSKVLLTDNGKPATSATQVAAGDLLVYQITVTNSGGSTGSQSLKDPVPPNTTYTGTGEGWSCATGSAAGTACDQTVPVGGNGTTQVTYTVTVANPLPAGTASIFNNVTPTIGVCNPTCSPANPTAAVLSTAKVLLTDNGKQATPATQVAAGDVLVYQITVTNSGGSPGTQGLSDPVPANTTYTGTGEGWTCATGSVGGTACTQNLPVGANTKASVTYTVTVINPLPVGTLSVANNVTPTVGVCDPTCSPTNPTASVLSTSKVLLSDNGKPATSSTQVAAGDVLVYQITVTNSGGSPDSQILKDPVPANTTYTGTGEGWSCTSGASAGAACDQTVPVGANTKASVTYTVTVVNPLPVGTLSVANTVTPTIGICDPSCSPINATGAVLSTSKILLTDNGAPATAASQVAAGDVLVYQITVTNTGGSPGTQGLHDPVPANTTYTGAGEGWSCASGSVAGTACDQTVPVAGNATAQVTYTVTVASPLPVGTASVANTVTPTVGICNPTCSPTNATAAVLSTSKALISDDGMPATSATEVAAGDVLIYQITVTNTGGSSGVQGLSDPVPANTTYTGTGQGWSCATGSTAGTPCTQGVTVAGGATATKFYTVTVASPLPTGTATISNNVTPTVGICDPTCSPTNPTAAFLSTAKVLLTDNGTPATAATQVAAGDVLVYQITVTNTGGSPGSQTLKDPVPANTTYTGTGEGWTCATGSVAGTACDQTVPVGGGSTAQVTYTLTVANPLPVGTASVANTVTPTVGICNPTCSPTNATAAVLSTAKILLTDNGKPATSATQVAAGDVLVYQITVTNTGGSPGSQGLHDPVPANTTYTGTGEGWTCATGSVAGTACDQTVPVGGGSTAQVTYTVTVANPLPVGTASVANTVTPTIGICDPTCSPTNPTAAVLSTAKVLLTDNGTPATAATQVAAGDVLVYQITVTNTGGSPGSQGLHDPVPANTTYTGTGEGWTCASGSVAGTACDQTVPVGANTKASVTYTVTVVKPLPVGTVSVANTVTPTIGICDPTCAPNNATAAVLATAKVLLTDNGKPATSATQVAAGDVLVYQITVTNTGGSPGSQTLKDPVPANTTYTGTGEGWSCATGSTAGTACNQTAPVAASATAQVTYTVTVANPLPVGTTSVANTVTPTVGACDPSCSPTNATASVLATAKVLLTDNGKPATSATQVAAGDVLVYQITVTNSGGSQGTQGLSDPVPANTTYTGSAEGWSCASGSVAGTACTQNLTVVASGKGSVTYTVTVVTPLPAGTASIANTVTPTVGICDPTCSPTDPSVSALDTIKTLATDNGNPATAATEVKAGDVLVYDIVTTNTGGSPGTTGLSETVPANTTYTGSGEGWSCATGSKPGTSCTQSVMVAAGGTVTKTFTETVANPLPPGTTSVSNQLTTTTGTCSSCDPSNPTAGALDTVKTLATIAGAKATPGSPVYAGDVLVYDIVTTNSGGSPGTTVLSETVPANTTYTGTGEGWSCAAGSLAGTICTQSVTVAAGASLTVTFTDTVVSPIPTGTTSVSNQVTTSVGTCTSCDPSNPVANPSLTLDKKAGMPIDVNHDGVTDAGDTITYTFLVTNTGNVVDTEVTINDPKLTGVSCPQSTLAPGASETCVSSSPYTITPADVAAGQVTNTASAIGTTPGGTAASSGGSTAVVPMSIGSSTPFATPSGPPTPTPTAPITPSTASPSILAFTGANLLRLAGLAVVLLAAGLALLAVVRRRREP
jgi:uncharacterized repeat protein (TIGR01451 family)